MVWLPPAYEGDRGSDLRGLAGVAPFSGRTTCPRAEPSEQGPVHLTGGGHELSSVPSRGRNHLLPGLLMAWGQSQEKRQEDGALLLPVC